MSTERLTRIACDRCPATITVADGDRRDGWGQLNAVPAGEGRALQAQDLCPACFDSLFAWRTDSAAHPAPAPAVPPRKPEVSKPARLAAYATAEEAIVATVTHAIAAIRQEPTMILGDDLKLDTVVDAKPIATTLVDQLIRDFGLLRRGK